MAEENKKEEQKVESKNSTGTFVKIILGFAFLGLAAYLLVGRNWWEHTWLVVKGCAVPFLVLAGIITLAIAKE
ncbi:MAG: hypothetical protein WDL87_03635 [Candidatus Omnitrophota bacterium]|jgi:TRAP-type mannitol/chloroaromatic compound transport system permease large subunit